MSLVIALFGEDRGTEALLSNALCEDRSTRHWEPLTSMCQSTLGNMVASGFRGPEEIRWLREDLGATFIRVLTGPVFELCGTDRVYEKGCPVHCAYTIAVNGARLESAVYWLNSALSSGTGREEDEPAGEYDFRCLECNVSLGPGNARQLCGKTTCDVAPYWA